MINIKLDLLVYNTFSNAFKFIDEVYYFKISSKNLES